MALPCGTNAAYKRHVKNGTTPCELCKIAHREYNYAWKQSNIKSVKESARKWANSNRENHLKWNIENSDKRKSHLKKYYENNKDKYRDDSRIRRARIKNVEINKYTEEEVLSIYGDNCHICGFKIDLNASRRSGQYGWENGLHIDHVIPIALGGPDSIENVRPSHGKCNLLKGSRV